MSTNQANDISDVKDMKIGILKDDTNPEGAIIPKEIIKENNLKIANPEVKLFMIIELTSSTVFTSITTGKPLPIQEYKKYLYDEIRKMLSEEA